MFHERGTAMELNIKTVSFGGYDKKATETFVLELEKKYEDEIKQLQTDAEKLSEAVKGLQQMRETNMTESKSTIDNLKSANEDMQQEIARLKEELDSFKNRENESASRYESISRTLLSARESADAMTRKTNEECEAKMAETTAQCKNMIEETTSRCEAMKTATETECDRLLSETQSTCQEQKETAYAECESLRRKTKEDTDRLSYETQQRCEALSRETEERCENLKSQTEAACARLKEDTISECDAEKSASREEIRQNRAIVKREFDSIGTFMATLQNALIDVTTAVDETKKLTDSAFSDLTPSATSDDSSVTSEYSEESETEEY